MPVLVLAAFAPVVLRLLSLDPAAFYVAVTWAILGLLVCVADVLARAGANRAAPPPRIWWPYGALFLVIGFYTALGAPVTLDV